uniref:Flavodoxin family protein n=1 Tax=candidate division WOR-3 bacterium TaxID=2052148 RepID=A0A7C6EAR8_UNCW3
MAKVLIVYYSATGNTKKMAEYVAEGVKKEKVEVVVKKVAETKPKDLLNYDGIIIGSPTYYGGAAAPIRDLIDKSVKFHGKLKGKVGGAFTSSGCIGGGNETTILSILSAMLIHGMVIQGDSDDDHYGPVAIEAPDERAKANCLALGERVGRLVKKLFG